MSANLVPPGPALWIRIQHRFGPRMMEWFMAAHTAMFGIVLLMAPDIYQQPAFSGFRTIFPAQTWLAWLMLGLGALRIGGLIVNGARKNVTPRIRQVSAGVGCLIWFGITYGFASSDVLSTWLAVYPLFAIGELVNIHRAARDEGEARHGRTV